MSPKDESTSTLQLVRRRGIYRAWHRGTKELDFILGHFCDAHVHQFDGPRLELFETVMAYEETELQQWLMGQAELPAGETGEMLGEIRAFHLYLKSNSNLADK